MKDKKLTIVAKIIANQEHIELVKTGLINLIETTKKEEGCINYDLHQDNEKKHIFLFYENWTSWELWQKHMKNSHIAEFTKATEGVIEKVILYEMTHIG